jgi:hypothetical protein
LKRTDRAVRKVYLYFYTDSVGFPRATDQSADITWPFVLKDLLERRDDAVVYLNMRGLGGGRIGEIESIFERDRAYFRGQESGTFSFAIFNVGVVDAAPRPFTYHLKSLTKVPVVGKHAWALLSRALHSQRKSLQQMHSFRLTSPRAFSASFARMVGCSRAAGLIPISVDTPLTPLWLEDRSPGLRDSIVLYNSLKHADRVAVHVPTDWVADEHYLDCGHHLSAAGHEQLAQRLHRVIGEFVNA